MTYQLDRVTISREGRVVLEDLSLTLPAGRVTGLIGPNGVGKSTLLAALAGDLRLDHGQIKLNQNPVTGLGSDLLAHRRAIMSQQAPAIFNLTVMQVLELGLHAFMHWPRGEQGALLNDVAQVTEVAQWLGRSITELSIGQQQRVHFARTLLQAKAAYQEYGCAWLLLDEPTANQDPGQQQLIMAVSSAFAANDSVGVLLVMHDLTLAAQWCENIIVLKDRGVLASGKVSDVLTPETLKLAYGSELNVQVLWEPVPGVIMSRQRSA